MDDNKEEPEPCKIYCLESEHGIMYSVSSSKKEDVIVLVGLDPF